MRNGASSNSINVILPPPSHVTVIPGSHFTSPYILFKYIHSYKFSSILPSGTLKVVPMFVFPYQTTRIAVAG